MSAVLATVACTTITEELPQDDPGPPTAPVPIVVVPVPLPSPANPAPAPTPTPAPGDPPPPDPNPPPPGTSSCRLPPGGGSGHNCPRQSPSFLSEVEAAMDHIIRTEPRIFNLDHTRGCGSCYLVVDTRRFEARMVEVLGNRHGLCAFYDGEELGVKNTNAFNDQYDILTSDMYVRRQLGSYRSTCYPAWF